MAVDLVHHYLRETVERSAQGSEGTASDKATVL